MSNEQTIRNAVAGQITKLNNYPFEAQGQLWGRDLSKVIDAVTKAVLESGAVETVDKRSPKPLVDRVEVIDGLGRSYINMGALDVSTALQDEGRTLKVFIGGKSE